MAIELRHIYKSFGGKQVLTNLCLILPEMGTTAIMGASGTGKTTLANILLGLVRPDHGEIRGMAGKKISAVFQEDRLLEHKSGLDNILFVLPKPRAAKAAELLHATGLSGDARKKTRDYSGGMKRRLALCRALAADFDVLILDEPFKGLDEALKPKIMAMVKEHTRDATLILITHDKLEGEFFGAHIIDIEAPPILPNAPGTYWGA